MSDAVRCNATQSTIERNRANAQQSTGPKTAAGKVVSRQNALKHGLCANPASGIAECPEAFQTLHGDLIRLFQPVDPVEQGLVHRIAVALWRLQRAASIASAISSISANVAAPIRARTSMSLDHRTA